VSFKGSGVIRRIRTSDFILRMNACYPLHYDVNPTTTCVTGGSERFWRSECHTPLDPPLSRGTILFRDSGTDRLRLACSTAFGCEPHTVELSLAHLHSAIWCAGVRVPPLPPARTWIPDDVLVRGPHRSLHRTVHPLAFALSAAFYTTRLLSETGRDSYGLTGPCGPAGRCRSPSPLRRSPGAILSIQRVHVM
jgi:hypothetical protein